MGIRIIETCDACGEDMGSECCKVCGSKQKHTDYFTSVFTLEKSGKKTVIFTKEQQRDRQKRRDRINEVLYEIVRKKMNLSDDYGLYTDDISDIAGDMSNTYKYDKLKIRIGPWKNGIVGYHFKVDDVAENKYQITWKVYFGTIKMPNEE